MLRVIKRISNYCCLVAAIILGVSGVLTQDVVTFKLFFSLSIALGLIFLNNNHNHKFKVN